MNRPRRTLTLALLAALAAPAAHAEVAIDVIGDSEISFEGLVQVDFNDYDNDVANLDGDAGDGLTSDSELRRAELVFKGKGPGNIDWSVGYDAKADKFLDTWAKYKIGGDKNHFVQLGQFKQPISLEELSSTKNNDFISKATITNTFAVGRRLGAAYFYGQDNWSVSTSYFSRELTTGLAHGNGYGVRGTWAPINEKGHILHFGLAYVNMDTDGDVLRLRARPNADLAGTRLVDTGSSGIRNADRMSTVGAEMVYVRGPLKLQSEYMVSSVDRYATGAASQPGSDFDASGYYASALWNVTGETWGYKVGVPATSEPINPVGGMWQVGLRYDHLDLDDGRLVPGATPTAAPFVDGVLGGEMNVLTAGVNWYWRSNFKFMLNYVMVDSERYNSGARRFVEDNPNIISARAQFMW